MPFWNKQEVSMREVIINTDMELRRLRSKYEMILERELQIARLNKKHKRKSNANYTKIGIAYYSIYIINETQWRLQEITTNNELNKAMEDLDNVFRAVNKLEKRIGDVNVEGIVKDLNRLDGYASFREENLKETYSALDEHIHNSTINIDNLVENSVINHLIEEDDCLEECLEKMEGIQMDIDTANGDIYKTLKEMNDPNQSMERTSQENAKKPVGSNLNFDGQL